MRTAGSGFWGALRRSVIPAAMMAMVGSTLVKADPVPRRETLEAIHAVENPHNSRRPGPCGELGPYQFREKTWRMHTRMSFARALDPQASDEVARIHYDWVCRQLRRHGFPVTPYTVALAWNAGLEATVRGRVSHASRDYAARVEAIAEELFQTSRSAIAIR